MALSFGVLLSRWLLGIAHQDEEDAARAAVEVVYNFDASCETYATKISALCSRPPKFESPENLVGVALCRMGAEPGDEEHCSFSVVIACADGYRNISELRYRWCLVSCARNARKSC